MSYHEIKFDDIETMTKEEAINELKKFFKGHKKFIEIASATIYTTHGFEKIGSMSIQMDTWNWEKLLGISIDAETGFKSLYYRKGNQKYRKSERLPDGNETFDIDGFSSTIYYTATRNIEEFQF